jgi:hypothetical protein
VSFRPASVTRQPLEELARLLGVHLQELAGTTTSAAAWQARETLAVRLRFQFRRVTGSPAALFVALALDALDLERLRGDLVLRALFGRGRGETP